MLITFGMLRLLISEAAGFKRKGGPGKQQPVSVPDVLYHATSDQYLKSIMSSGLQPRAGADGKGRAEYNDPRIFFTDDPDAALEMFEWLGHPGEPALLSVNVPSNATFYDDLDAGPGCYWTSDPISSEFLELVEDE